MTEIRISEPEIERNEAGTISAIRFAFGPHYFVEVEIEDECVLCYLGATHHGIRADASAVGGELEQFVDELKRRHPQNEF